MTCDSLFRSAVTEVALMDKLRDKSGAIVFAVVFVASVFMLLADNAVAR